MTHINTFTGKQIDLVEPHVDMIDLLDIVHALSKLDRFTGHAPVFYSVLQHLLVGAQYIDLLGAKLFPKSNRSYKLAFLAHDMNEAYNNDISHPMKMLLRESSSNYDVSEERFQALIRTKFNVPNDPETIQVVKAMDAIMLRTEFRSFFPKECNDRLDPYFMQFKPLDIVLTVYQPGDLVLIRAYLYEFGDFYVNEDRDGETMYEDYKRFLSYRMSQRLTYFNIARRREELDHNHQTLFSNL